MRKSTGDKDKKVVPSNNGAIFFIPDKQNMTSPNQPTNYWRFYAWYFMDFP